MLAATLFSAMSVRLRKPLFLSSLLLGLVLLCSTLTYQLSVNSGIDALRAQGNRQLELHTRGVESEIERFVWLPGLLQLHPATLQLLLWPDAARRQQVNRHLAAMNARSGTLAIYVMDGSGRVLASSNWQRSDSYVGEDLSFRPYFHDAMAGHQGRFYGIGSTVGEPGYYLSSPLLVGGRITGVAVVKVKLSQLEAGWQKAGSNAFIVDENGVIILSSKPRWRLHAVKPVPQAVRNRLAQSLQYHWAPLPVLELKTRQQLAPGLERWELPDNDTTAATRQFLAQSRTLNDTRWQLTLLSPLAAVKAAAWTHAMLAAAVVAVLTLLLIAWNERRKVIATRLAAREALQEANSELEKRIAERTADLTASNDRLLAEIRERELAEQTLRKAQNELIQAGKLAVIGQMSTSIAHELNQPLAALRTLSGNTVKFLGRGAYDVAAANLKTIGELVERMGKITGSLRSFARRSEHASGQARPDVAIDAALFLLQPRLSRQPVTVLRELAPVLLAIDQTRLEQILVNLVGNALDALQGVAGACITLSGHQDGDGYVLTVADNGGGLPPEVLQHLFEPFFTTKPPGSGLGLGLTLSASLAAAAGGSLQAQSQAQGAAFVLRLPLCPSQEASHV